MTQPFMRNGKKRRKKKMMLETESDKKDALIDTQAELSSSICKMVAAVKQKQTMCEPIVYVDNDGNDAIAYAYDSRKIRMSSSMTLDALAYKYLGSPDYAGIIACYNGIQNEHEIAAGTVIKIPVLTPEKANQNNRIYAVPGDSDNYGRDIAIDDDGDFAVSGGDIAVVSGVENLNQAIAMRLTTAAEKRIRLNAYGIKAQIGENAVKNYLLSTVEQTVLADPRVSEINEITLKGDNDKVYITVEYTDINGNKQKMNEEI